MNLLLWILFGAVVGWIASIIMKQNSRMGIIANIVVGLIGSVIGGWIASSIAGYSLNMYSWQGFVFSILGAIILLAVLNVLTRNKRL